MTTHALERQHADGAAHEPRGPSPSSVEMAPYSDTPLLDDTTPSRHAEPDDLADAREDLVRLFAEDAQRISRAVRLVPGIVVLAGAVLAAISQFPFFATPFAMGAGIAGAFLAAIGGAWLLFTDKTDPRTMAVALRATEVAQRREILAERTHRALSERLVEDDVRQAAAARERDWLKGLYVFSLELLEFGDTLRARRWNDQETVINTLLRASSKTLTSLVQFDREEEWSIAIYVPKEDDPATLRCVASIEAERAEEYRDRREWRIGEGVVGHAFQSGRETVVEDASDAERAHWLNVPARLRRASDRERYISLVGLPLFGVQEGDASPDLDELNGDASEDTPPIVGVLIASSDQSGRFCVDEEGSGSPEIEPLRLFALALSSALRGAAVVDPLKGNAEIGKAAARAVPPVSAASPLNAVQRKQTNVNQDA